jgi:pyridoxal phosphate enzyme (YggS family)
MVIKNNIKAITGELSGFCQLIAVSKTQPIERLQEAYDAGQRIFGENKAQELASKYAALPKDIEWHMIGHLQTNKVKYIAPFVALIHSIDSIKLLEEVDKQAKKANRKISCLLQVHIAKEETKFGFDVDEVKELLSSDVLKNFSHIEIKGLMGMATFTENQQQIRSEFALINNLFKTLKNKILPDNVEMKELSIGMSSDYKIAIEEGSTFVRVGTAIFGSRNYN